MSATMNGSVSSEQPPVVNGHEEEEQAEEKAHSEDALEPVFKHPLKHNWRLWYFKLDRAKRWEDNNMSVTAFKTVEDFWCVQNHILNASKINTGCDYSVFKDGISPMWEDPVNKNGGRWMVSMNKNQRHNDLDHVWLEILLCLIGEAFGKYGDEICGAVVNIRNKGDKLGLWTKNWKDQEAVMAIGRILRERLQVPESCIIGYQAHHDQNTKQGSSVMYRYRV